MIALLATVLTSTASVIVVCAAPHLVYSANMTMPDNETVIIEIPPVYYCENNLQCPAAYGYSRCENRLCMCDENFYPEYNSTTKKTYCRLCSLFQDSCEETQCCQNPHATVCLNGMCVCRPGMDEECLGRYTPTLGIQLANTLSVSFAFVFLAITFIAVVRKTFFSCGFCRCDSMSRVASNSSLNEFVKQKMQNRPPCYDEIEKDRKVPIDTSYQQPPPEYSSSQYFGRGASNVTFSISDEVEMIAAPPNYSTFTTATDVNATASASGNNREIRGEIILTRPIYMNGCSPQNP